MEENPVPYVDERVRNEARDNFATLMSVPPDDVPESLLDLWWKAQHMANMLQPGPMDVRHMAILVLLDQTNRANVGKKAERDAVKHAMKTGVKKARTY